MPSPLNKTLTLSEIELEQYTQQLEKQSKLINADIFTCDLPEKIVDLLILDPPYNLTKNYDGQVHKKQTSEEYANYFEEVLGRLKPTLKLNATVYVCADWATSLIVAPVLAEHFFIQNRITWARRKGRASKANWKNSSEDIWFCTCSDKYYFNSEAVLTKKKNPTYRGGGVKLTGPTNFWTDITVPFWAMSENTEHSTQKSEKLAAKLILASTKPGDFVFDPFAGSGTVLVAAEKLGRRWAGVEISTRYCCIALKRLALGGSISGYDGTFDYCRDEYGL